MGETVTGPFWTSGTFWGAAGVIVAMVSGVAAVWATLQSAHPKRQLVYDYEVTSIVTRNHTLANTLELRRNGELLINPHVVRIDIRNTGRRDIPSAAFDSEMPVCFNLGAQILEVLDVHSHSAEAQPPRYEIVGQEVHIRPGRIGRGTGASYTLLADGLPALTLTNSLIDIEVKRGTAHRWERRAESIGEWLEDLPTPIAFFGACLFIGLIIYGLSYLFGGTGGIDFRFNFEKV
ncbi:hypothetical protein [Streptomyces sp. BA2]|uniref:hypothetical protein n=1 Tax=Streptomyces sp. BA2 TaxID=436595 RepID=UPI001329A42A|nr:hypothetical protein [Streptomyces sp. BA2]MWA08115.1 hypothetical protein [Streptomyces sp. BA2]